MSPAFEPEADQTPGEPTPVASFNVTQLGDKPDKLGKDDNFRGIGIFDNVLYYTKGSGGNGVNTLYFVDTTGNACPTGGVGLPQPGAALPTSPLAYDPSTLTSTGLPSTGLPSNMCILKGFPTTLARPRQPRRKPRPSGRSPRRSVAAATRELIQTSWSQSLIH